MPITYRRATIDDAPLIVDLRIRSIDEDSGLTEPEKESLRASNMAYIANAMPKDAFVSFLAYDGDRPVGTASACLHSVMPGKKLPLGQDAYIQNVYVSPGHRRRGVGKALIGLLLEEIGRRGDMRITLHATKMGQALFRECGFDTTENLGLTEMAYAKS